MISCGLGKEEREVEKKENGILKQVYTGSIVQSWWRNTHHFVVNGEKNVKAGTVGGNSSFLELLSSDCVKAEVVSLDRNLKTQIFQPIQFNRNLTMDNNRSNEKTKLFCHIYLVLWEARLPPRPWAIRLWKISIKARSNHLQGDFSMPVLPIWGGPV